MKKRLVILSDLWGKEKSQWLAYYTKGLAHDFEIQYYDCCELGRIDKSVYTEEALHLQFVNGGIDSAIKKLVALEKEPIHMLAFSIGGVIGWQFGLKTERISSLWSVSSTRLRYETSKPSGQINLYFGANDHYAPRQDWFDLMSLDCNMLIDDDHMVYTKPDFASDLCSMILAQE